MKKERSVRSSFFQQVSQRPHQSQDSSEKKKSAGKQPQDYQTTKALEQMMQIQENMMSQLLQNNLRVDSFSKKRQEEIDENSSSVDSKNTPLPHQLKPGFLSSNKKR